MRERYEADLVWRFRDALAPERVVPSPSGREDPSVVAARRTRVARREEIDATLAKLDAGHVKVLERRYGRTDVPLEVRRIFRESAAVAVAADEAMRAAGASPAQDGLAAACRRVEARAATRGDLAAIDAIRSAAERSVAAAERAYEAAYAGVDHAPSRRLKKVYTVRELARSLGVSRWTVRRWLDANRIPYERRSFSAPGAARGGKIVVLLSELRTYAPAYFEEMRERLAEDA